MTEVTEAGTNRIDGLEDQGRRISRQNDAKKFRDGAEMAAAADSISIL